MYHKIFIENMINQAVAINFFSEPSAMFELTLRPSSGNMLL